MIRWIAALAALFSLTGCVTTEYVYRDRYYDRYDGYAYDDGHGGRVYVDRDSYYSPSYAGRGDYYIGADYGWYPSYYDYPAYYSLFWPMRSWYDPYWYPGYYYGVTFFPRHYWNVGLSYGWPHYSHWYYSPYRYSWVDNYYDWRPWYGHGHNTHYAPRYGSARNEAERLSRRADEGWDYGRGTTFRGDRGTDRRDPDQRTSDAVRRTPYGTFGTTRDPSRDADYGGHSSPRRDIGQHGFGVPSGGEVRRQDPGTQGFGAPVQARGEAGYAGRGDQGEAMRELRRQSYEEGLALPGSSSRRESAAGYQRYARESEAMREARSRRGYDAGEAPRGGWTQPQRSYSQRESAPAMGSYDAAPRQEAPARGYDSGARYEAPVRGYDGGAREAPSFSAPPQQSYSAPEPAQRESPRFESRGSDFGRSESRSESRSDGGSRDEVRRVGNNRGD